MNKFNEELSYVIKQIQIVTDHLYKQDIKVAYELLGTVLVDLTKIIDTVFAMKDENETNQFDINNLMGKLSEALQAMETGDTVLLADILQYEIMEELNNIADGIE